MEKRIVAIIGGVGIAVLVIIASVMLYQGENNSNPQENITTTQGEESSAIVLVLKKGETIKRFSLENLTQIGEMVGKGGYLKTTGTIVGPDEYTGVPINDLLNQVGGISETNEVIVEASDGYSVRYTYEMVQGFVTVYDQQGQRVAPRQMKMVLAYKQNGATVDGELRIAYVTASEEGTAYLTDSNLWVKYVSEIEIVEANSSWKLNLMGFINDSISQQYFEAAMYNQESPHEATVDIAREDGRTDHYQGLALWRLIAMVDGGENETNHYVFNDSLVGKGYQVKIVNADGEELILGFDEIARNDSYILAIRKNSVPLSDDGPLKLVASSLSPEQMLSHVTELWLIKPSSVET